MLKKQSASAKDGSRQSRDFEGHDPVRLDMSNERPRQLFAAMNVLDGTVIGRNMQRHRHLPEACGTFAVADRRDEGADQRDAQRRGALRKS